MPKTKLVDPLRPLGESPSLGNAPLSQVPVRRIIGWTVFALLVIGGIALFFLYGDFVAPVLVMMERSRSGDIIRSFASSA